MRVPFIKMHGLGNDFVVLDARHDGLLPMTARTAAALADRREGIGCDQLVLLEPSAHADFRMRIFNNDGGEAGACGNAARAVALLHGSPARVETAGGIISVEPDESGARVDMGRPLFDWDAIPLAYPMDTLSMPVGWEGMENPSAVNVGNPHIVCFVADCDAIELDRIGPEIEHDPLFSKRINVNCATVESRDRIRLRVWERGAGLTRACGTGACATSVVAMRRGLVDNRVTVVLPGGPLTIEWADTNPAAGASIVMTGPATEAYRGSFEWDHYG